MAEWRRERPEVDPSPQGVIGRLHRLGDYLDRALTENFARIDLTRGEFDVLATLRRAGAPYERTAGALAEHAMITSGGLTKRVDRLEARGLLQRTVDGADTRKRRIALTDEGLSLVERAYDIHMELEHRLIAEAGVDSPALAASLRAWLLTLE